MRGTPDGASRGGRPEREVPAEGVLAGEANAEKRAQ